VSWSLDSAVAQESATTHPATSNTFTGGVPATLAGVGGTFIDATGAIPASTFRDAVDARVTAIAPAAVRQTVRYYKTATQSCAHGADVQVTFDATDADLNDNFGQSVAGNNAFTLPAGRYEIVCSLRWASSATNRRQMAITRNSTTAPTGTDPAVVDFDNRAAPSHNNGSTVINIRRRWTSASTLRVWGLQNSLAPLDLVTTWGGCDLTITRLGD